MPVLFDEGVLGLEALHTWNSVVTLNDAQGNFPRYKLQRITGMGSLSEFEDLRAPAVGRIGEIIYPTGPRGKTVVYEGVVQALTLSTLRQASYDLRAAFSERSDEGIMQIAPLAAYHGGVDYPVWEFYGRVMQLDMDEEQAFSGTAVPSPFQRYFTVGIRMSDPRFYLDTDAQEVSGVTNLACPNPGNAPVDPNIVITGAAGDVTVQRTGGAALVFDDLPAGNLTLDFRARTAMQGAVNVGAALNVADSNWWDPFVDGIPAGGTTISQTGGSGMTITYKPASW